METVTRLSFDCDTLSMDGNEDCHLIMLRVIPRLFYMYGR